MNVAPRHVYQVRRRLQVEQCGAHVRVDLGAQIVQALAALLESRIGLQYVTVNTTALKNRNRQGSAQVEYLGCIRGMRPSRAVVPVERE